jgi:hypothetical protein
LTSTFAPNQSAVNAYPVAAGPRPTLLGTIVGGTLIANPDPTYAAYLGTNSSVSATTGIRVGALGSITWTTDAIGWAILDPAAPSTITLRSANVVDNPDNPLDVAAALIAGGIPSKLLTTLVGTFTIPLASGGPFPLPVDLSPYASVFVKSTPGDNVVNPFTYWWTQPGVAAPTIAPDYLVPNGPVGGNQISAVLPVYGSTLTITNGDNATHPLTLYGFNRQANSIPLLNGTSAIGARWENTGTFAAGYSNLPLISGQLFQGLAWFNYTLAFPSTPTGLIWYLGTVPAGQNPAGNNAFRFVMSSGQMLTASPLENASKLTRFGWLGACQSGPFDWYAQFSATTPAGSTTLSLSATPAGPL